MFKTFVINLEKRKDRLEKLDIKFKWERFDAFNGLSLKLPGASRHILAHIGCLESHKRLLKHIKDSDLDFVIIFEDDVELCENFEYEFKKIYAKLPSDWDLLYLGGNNVGEIKKYTEGLNIAEKVYTTHAYIIRNKFIDIILDEFNKRNWRKGIFEISNYWKVDVILASCLPLGKCFICSPLLAWQREGFSDIENKITNNVHLKNK